MNKNTKTFLSFMLAVVLFASFAIAGCNNSSEKAAEPAKDSANVEKSMEAPSAPVAVPDSTQKRDTAKTRPTPGGA